jgi:hypothetical protein
MLQICLDNGAHRCIARLASRRTRSCGVLVLKFVGWVQRACVGPAVLQLKAPTITYLMSHQGAGLSKMCVCICWAQNLALTH